MTDACELGICFLAQQIDVGLGLLPQTVDIGVQFKPATLNGVVQIVAHVLQIGFCGQFSGHVALHGLDNLPSRAAGYVDADQCIIQRVKVFHKQAL